MPITKAATADRLKVVVGSALRARRLVHKLTQYDAARVAGCTQAAVSNYESAKRLPPLDVVLNLARLYGVTVEDLADGA